MRTVQINIFEFSELSPKAKQNALDNYRNNSDFWDGYEAIKTLEKGAEYFGSSLMDYSIDWSNSSQRSTVKFAEVTDALVEASVRELIQAAGSYDAETLKGNGDCELTGVSTDESFLDGIRIGFFKDDVTDISDLLQLGFESLLKACAEDYQYQYSEEGYIETCEANEYEFTADGELYTGESQPVGVTH